METTQMAKQLFEFQKTSFNNAYTAISMVQDQAEAFGSTIIDQNPALPQPAKDAISDWLKMCKNARDEYKKAIDESFKTMEAYFSGADEDK